MYISLGRDSITNSDFSIDSTKHISIEGMSGMGKSTLLVNLFVEHIRQGNGGLFIDPHGDTADQIAKLIPKNRMRDFIWIACAAVQSAPFQFVRRVGAREGITIHNVQVFGRLRMGRRIRQGDNQRH